MSKTLIAICFLLMTQACSSRLLRRRLDSKLCRNWMMTKSLFFNFCNKGYVKDKTQADFRKCRWAKKVSVNACGRFNIPKDLTSFDCNPSKSGLCLEKRTFYNSICVEKKWGDASKCPCFKSQYNTCLKNPKWAVLFERFRMAELRNKRKMARK